VSVILDALRKLDREKSSRRNGTANIAMEILRPDLSRPGKKVPPYIAALSLTAIAAAAVTYGLMSGRGFLSKPAPTVAVSPPAQSQQAIPAPLSREPIRDVRDETSGALPKIETPARSKSIETSSTEKKTERNVIPEEAKVAPENTKKPMEHTPGVTIATPPSLKISAIVWYEDPSKRFAMINGTISTEGSLVDGVKVVEIHPTSVRFLHDGQYFEIPISK
jgi:general secretion pathway protein B